MSKIIGKVIATEKNPSTIDDFYFWTKPDMILNPFENEVVATSYETLADTGFYKTRLNAEIRAYESPFILANVDEMNLDLARFYWDAIYWLNFALLPIEELAIKILNSPLSSVFQEKFIELIRDNLDKFNLECIIISNSNQILKVIINENNSN